MSHALDDPAALSAAAADYLRRAVDTAVDHVFTGAAVAAVLALLVLVFVAPRRFPVLPGTRAGGGSAADRASDAATDAP